MLCYAVLCSVLWSECDVQFGLPPHCLLLPDALLASTCERPQPTNRHHPTPVHAQAYNYETQKLAVLSQEDSAIWVS